MTAEFRGDILALDLATRVGWAMGPIDGKGLTYGSFRCAPSGASSGAVFGALLKWLVEHMSAFKPRLVVFEAPIDPRHLKKITADTIRRLQGMPSIVEAVCDRMGVYDVREVETGDLKHYWHGKRNIPRETVKKLTFAKMQHLGYDPSDEDAADAISVHRYMAGSLDPRFRLEASPLFSKAKVANVF